MFNSLSSSEVSSLVISKANAHIEGIKVIGSYRIISKKVRVGDIYTNGDSIHEFGYDDGQDYYYRDTENFRKLADVITFDDKGNPIRLKDRFNYKNSDIHLSVVLYYH